VVGQTIEQRGRHLGITEDARPFAEGLDADPPTQGVKIARRRTLNRPDRLRRMRRYSLRASDGVLLTRFKTVFGPLFAAATQLSLGELINTTGGGTPSRDRPEYFTGTIPWLTAKDMRGDYIWNTQEHVTQEVVDNSATKVVPPNSILLVVKSKILMHRLPVAITRVPLCHGQDIKSIQCSPAIHPEFGRFLLKFHEPRLLQIARGANTEGLTLPMLEELQSPMLIIPSN
jgi:type I restriction enzyme S subunit